MKPVLMDAAGNVMNEEDMVADKGLVFSLDGSEVPIDIMNKTIQELKEIGFKDVVSFKAQ